MAIKKKLISITIPCFNEELNVITTYEALEEVNSKIKRYNFEYVFVDNGSLDRTREKIKQLVRNDNRITGVFLSRNFGPEASGEACMKYARGDAVIIIEADLQDPPELIPRFVSKWEEGFDIVVGKRRKIEDNPLMTLMRKGFYRIFKWISNIEVPVDSGSYGLLSRRALNALLLLPEKYRFYRGLRAWIGFRTAYIVYNRKRRMRGTSSYSFSNYIKHAERGVFGFSYIVLDFMAYAGFMLTILSFVFIAFYLLFFFLFGNPIKGAVTILVSIVFFGGIQLMSVSILGKYIQVIVEETKSRPTYIVEEVVGKKRNLTNNY